MDEFIIITWPESQMLFDIDGFQENSLLINDGPLYDEFGDSTYMVRKSWIENGSSKLYSLQEIRDAFLKESIDYSIPFLQKILNS